MSRTRSPARIRGVPARARVSLRLFARWEGRTLLELHRKDFHGASIASTARLALGDTSKSGGEAVRRGASIPEELAATPFKAPVVDELSVRVVVDSHYERFLPKVSHPHARIEHVGAIRGRQMTTIAAEWGLSLHLSSVQASARVVYLFDFGYTPEILKRNLNLLDIDPAAIHGLILSHGHRDHFGGLDGFVMQYRSQMRRELVLYAGGETALGENRVHEKDGKARRGGMLSGDSLEAQDVATVYCRRPRALDGAFTSGHIHRQSFEEDYRQTTGEDAGGPLVAGTDDDHGRVAGRRGDVIREEHAICYIVKGRGLVVIAPCSHAGIINTVKSAMSVANVDKVHAVIGGFHLCLREPEYLRHSLRELDALNPDVIIPMHCTGEPFIQMIHERMPEKLIYSNVGSRFTFGI